MDTSVKFITVNRNISSFWGVVSCRLVERFESFGHTEDRGTSMSPKRLNKKFRNKM